MNRRFIKLSTLLLMLAIILAGCASSTVAPENEAVEEPIEAVEEPIVLKFGNIYAETTPTGKAGVKFCELVEEKTNGKVIVEHFPAEQLGNEQEMVESVNMGAIDLACPASSMAGLFAKQLLIFPVPYVIDDFDHLTKVMSGEIGQEMNNIFLEATGSRVIANNWFREPRFLYGSRPVNTLEELKGFRVRVPENPTWVESWKKLGASPTPMSTGEIFTGIQTGAIDGAETTISYYLDNGFNNVAPYLMKTSHVFEACLLIMNDAKFQSLPAEYQQAIIEAGNEAGLYHQEVVKKSVEEAYKIIVAEGGTVVEVDRENWIKRMDGINEAIWQVWGDEELYDRIRAAR